MTQHHTMLQRNLLYAGVTRGKKLVVLVGQKKAVAIATPGTALETCGRRHPHARSKGFRLRPMEFFRKHDATCSIHCL
jgi:hypothetical protein